VESGLRTGRECGYNKVRSKSLGTQQREGNRPKRCSTFRSQLLQGSRKEKGAVDTEESQQEEQEELSHGDALTYTNLQADSRESEQHGNGVRAIAGRKGYMETTKGKYPGKTKAPKSCRRKGELPPGGPFLEKGGRENGQSGD